MKRHRLNPASLSNRLLVALLENDWSFQIVNALVCAAIFEVSYYLGMGFGTVLGDFMARLWRLMVATV